MSRCRPPCPRALALVVSIAACSLPGPARAAQPTAAAPARDPVRVAVLLPYVGDALRAIEGPFEVVAAVRRSLGRPVEGAVDLGSAHAPSYERLVEAQPDLVVGDASVHGPLRDRLAVSGGELLLLEARSVEATFAGLEEVGRRVGAGDAMAQATAEARRRLAALALEQPVPALVVFGAPGSFLVVTERTWLGDLLASLSFENVGSVGGGDERFPGLVALGDEVIAGLEPQLVLLVAHGDPSALRAAFEERLAGPWSGVRAAATRGVHVLEPALFASNPGLAMPEAAARLVALAAGDDPARAAAAPGAPAGAAAR